MGRGQNSQVVHDEVWRRIFQTHPASLDLFQSGNEAMLLLAQQSNIGLRNAIDKHGMPTKELLDDIIRVSSDSQAGSQWHSAATMPFINDYALNDSQLQSFFSDGYLLCRNAVPMEIIALAKRFINASIGRGDVERKHGMTGVLPSLSTADELLNLFRGPGSKLSTIVQSLLGKGKVKPPYHAQVALRYPSPYLGAEADSARCSIGGKHWHVDGFGQGKHSPFTVLLGVCLSDCVSSGCGNFAVHPGAHWTLQENVRQQVLHNSEDFSKVEHEDSKPDLGIPVEMMMKAGDCVIAHQKLPHLGMPNCSPEVRYQVYFRLQHVNHDMIVDAWLDDLLLPFEPVKRLMS